MGVERFAGFDHDVITASIVLSASLRREQNTSRTSAHPRSVLSHMNRSEGAATSSLASDRARFVEACSAWAAKKSVPLADLFCEPGWITAEKQAHVEFFLERKLRKHRGGAQAAAADLGEDLSPRGVDADEPQRPGRPGPAPGVESMRSMAGPRRPSGPRRRTRLAPPGLVRQEEVRLIRSCVACIARRAALFRLRSHRRRRRRDKRNSSDSRLFHPGEDLSIIGRTPHTQDSLPVVGQTRSNGLSTRRVQMKGFRVLPTSRSPFPSLLGTI
jgi:hypothetical protein